LKTRLQKPSGKNSFLKKPHSFKPGLYPIAAGIALLLLPFGARAFDFSPDASRVLSDPAYMPLQGEVFGSTEYINSNTSSTTDNPVGALKFSTTTLSNTVNQVLGYGLTSEIELRVTDSYEWPSTTNSFPTGVVTVTHSDGFIDPTFTALWRVIDQQDHPLSWDLIASYSPNLINAQSADPTENGTVGRGGASGTFGTAISQKTRDFTFYLQGTATYLDNRTIFNPANNITTSYDPGWQYFINVATQTRFGAQWSLNLNYAETFNGGVNTSFVNGAGILISSLNQSGQVQEFTADLNFHVIPNRFVLSFIYNHYFYNGVSNTNQTLPANSTQTDEKDQDVLNGELRYVFF
jgi:hypothetical protein